jgi:hypothetical protein
MGDRTPLVNVMLCLLKSIGIWIRVSDDASNVIETHEHAGEFKE